MGTKSYAIGALTGLTLAFAATTSVAATCGTSADLNTNNVTITSINESSVTIAATDCKGAFEGNDTGDKGTFLDNLNSGIFAGFQNDWSLYGKSDEDNTVSADESKVGKWSVDYLTKAYSVFAVSLKASTGYVAYLFDLRPGSVTTAEGMFTTLGLLTPGNKNKPGNQPGLSHMTIAVYGEASEPPAPVPLPAAGWLMIAGLGGLAALRRRKRA